MDRVFQTLSEGLAGFLYGWVLPSAVAVGVILLLFPDLRSALGATEAIVQIVVFGFAAVSVSLLFSLTLATPTYRLLEGYTMPSWLASRLKRRQIKRFRVFNRIASRGDLPASVVSNAYEGLARYPRSESLLLPTRFGNTLRAGELYPYDVYELRLLAFWFELIEAAAPEARRNIDDTRSAVDFYVSSLLNSLLVVAASVFALYVEPTGGAVIALLGSILLVPLMYSGAVSNADLYRQALQALANTSRSHLANAFGFRLPATHEEEKWFWGHLHWSLTAEPDDLSEIDDLRIETATATSRTGQADAE